MAVSADPALRRYARFAWAALIWVLLVILWGAFVRATGSGAGCGDHWPACNGQVIPRDPSLETIIEFTHRLTSGVAMLAAVALPLWARRLFPAAHPARRYARLSLLLMLSEALLGAGLVVFGLVADNDGMARAGAMAAHLLNTFLLLAAMARTAYWATYPPAAPVPRRLPARLRRLGYAGSVGLLVVGMSGAIAALGDTLFPSESLAEAWAADWSSASHILIQLRILHPVLAVLVGAGIAAAAGRVAVHAPASRGLAQAVGGLVGLQIVLGVINVLLLAPVWMQLVHLLSADLLWLAWVLLAPAARIGAGFSNVPIPAAGEFPTR
jgi:heme A synthase